MLVCEEMRALLLILMAGLAACSAGRGRDPYGYERPGGAPVDPEGLGRHQDRERDRLERQQNNEHDQLLRRQQRERREQKQAGEWDASDKKEQAKERRQQDRRFDQQDEHLREHQRDERDGYY